MVTKLRLTREQLSQFLTDPEQIKQFEKLFSTASDSANTLNDLVSVLVALAAQPPSAQAEIDAEKQRIEELESRLKNLEGWAAQWAVDQGGDKPYLETQKTVVSNRPGRLNWATPGIFNAGLDELNIPIGLLSIVRMTNASGLNLGPGRVVRVSGAAGNLPTFNIAGCETNFDAIGVTAMTINSGQTGYVACTGVIDNMDATGAPYGEVWSPGDALYVGIGSGLTKNLPAKPLQQVAIGRVLSATSIFVFPNRDMKAQTLSDVVTGAFANGQLLIYDNAVGVWKNATLTAGAGGIVVTNAAGGITLSLANIANNQASKLMRSSVTLTDGAGAAVGTLTNSPVAGNPTKWIPIDDNGTIVHIPAW